MAIVGLTVGATKDHVYTGDPAYRENGKHLKDATVFKLGTLDSVIMGQINDKLTEFETGEGENATAKVNINEVSIETCRYGLKGWANFMDHEGNELVFKTNKVSMYGKEYDVVDANLIRQIPLEVLRELREEIQSLNDVQESDVKN